MIYGTIQVQSTYSPLHFLSSFFALINLTLNTVLISYNLRLLMTYDNTNAMDL